MRTAFPSPIKAPFGELKAGAWQLGMVDIVNRLSWKHAVRAATTAAVTLASGLEAGDTLDGLTLAAGDRVLVKDQADAAENGIYLVAASGAPSRSGDASTGFKLLGAATLVIAGTTNAGRVYRCTNVTLPVVGTDDIDWALLTIGDVLLGVLLDGDGLFWDADASAWVNRPAARHTHVVGEPFVADGSQTVFYLANEAQADTVAAYDGAGARVAITQDPDQPDKITFTVAPAAGTGFFDYIPATG